MITITPGVLSSVGSTNSSIIPFNALLWDDGSPILWGDGSYILWS